MIENVYYKGLMFQVDYSRPSLRFKGGSPKLPPAAPPPPPATVPDDITVEEERQAQRQSAKRRKGRKDTILTGGVLTDPDLQKKSLLGS